jgi:ActR/RegA family two-component response regulator
MNAVAFSSAGQAVQLSASASDGFVCFRVSDSGPGVAPELQGRIFEGGVSTRVGGSGIGLRHAKELSTRARATLELVTQSVGTCFELRWPIVIDDLPIAKLSEKTVDRSSSVLEGHSILLIEDDQSIVSLLQLALGARGATVRVASNAAQLRDVLLSGSFDSALVDLSPIEHAPRVELDRLRAANPELRVVLITGSAKGPSQDVLDCASAWIRKPFDVTEIVGALLGEPSTNAAQ